MGGKTFDVNLLDRMERTVTGAPPTAKGSGSHSLQSDPLIRTGCVPSFDPNRNASSICAGFPSIETTLTRALAAGAASARPASKIASAAAALRQALVTPPDHAEHFLLM